MSAHTTHTTPGTLCPHCQQPLQVTTGLVQSCALQCQVSFGTLFVSAGTLISHEKLLLQINTERELGNMDYKLGQV